MSHHTAARLARSSAAQSTRSLAWEPIRLVPIAIHGDRWGTMYYALIRADLAHDAAARVADAWELRQRAVADGSLAA